jgi:predicted transglutaminase-like cysteine proteinase
MWENPNQKKFKLKKLTEKCEILPWTWQRNTFAASSKPVFPALHFSAKLAQFGSYNHRLRKKIPVNLSQEDWRQERKFNQSINQSINQSTNQ